jgi:tRNA-(ms[2]io[6]A)-hydroxylase
LKPEAVKDLKFLLKILKMKNLKVFYRELMISEANHYTTFIGFARQLGDPEKVNKRWEEWLEYEAKSSNPTETKKPFTDKI